MEVTSAILPQTYANTISRVEQKKKYCLMQHLSVINKNNCQMQHLSVINEKRQMTEKLFSYPILCPLCHIHQRNQIKKSSRN